MSTDYVGDEKTTDQVKVMDRAGGAAFDYFGVHDNIADKVSTGGIRHLNERRSCA